MISILKETALADDIKDVEQTGENTLKIILNDDADVARIVKKVNGIDSEFWSTRAPISMTYVYENGSPALFNS
ncbi:hypothetical protein [Pedobacter nototheniae]|uniref:hypothetical protein n=1 Tax=Pedobacter nototheniae TaxID=2488994 RepID=UPI00293000D3|nr:hypothetical protein [Pedobacter nototheniae]